MGAVGQMPIFTMEWRYFDEKEDSTAAGDDRYMQHDAGCCLPAFQTHVLTRSPSYAHFTAYLGYFGTLYGQATKYSKYVVK